MQFWIKRMRRLICAFVSIIELVIVFSNTNILVKIFLCNMFPVGGSSWNGRYFTAHSIIFCSFRAIFLERESGSRTIKMGLTRKKTNEMRHDKTNKASVRPAKTDQPGQPRLIWAFAGRTLILLVLSCCGSNTHLTSAITRLIMS